MIFVNRLTSLGKSFKLEIQEQAGQMVMTPTLSKRLWTELLRGHRVKAGKRDLKNRIEERACRAR